MSEFAKRVATGILLLSVIVFVPYFLGNLGTVALVFCLSVEGLREFYSIFNNPKLLSISSFSFAMTGIFYILISFFPIWGIRIFLTLLSIGLLLIFLFDKEVTGEIISKLAMGFLYVPFLFSHLINKNNPEAFWLVFSIAFATDTFAFLGGKLLGEHKLIPSISPKKTVEGAVCGILGAVFFAAFFYYFIHRHLPDLAFAAMILMASAASQLGDLAASRWKRSCAVKDFGKLLPGHGGVLDRFDSVLFVAPIVHYYYILFV